MAATAAVFNTYELVEHIITFLPFKTIGKIQSISRQFRKIVTESPAVQKVRCVRPLKLSELKFSREFGTGRPHPALTAFMRTQMHPFKARDQFLFERYRKCGVDIPQAQFEQTPHYSIDSHIIFNNRFWPINCSKHVNPRSKRPPNPRLPSLIRMVLPDTHNVQIQRFRAEFITEPPITMLEIEAINFWEETIFSSCMLRNEKGITVADVVDTQKAMLSADPRYLLNCHRGLDDEQECYAWMFKNVNRKRTALIRFDSEA